MDTTPFNYAQNSSMKILIIRHDKLGDFILAFPAFYVLRKALPQASITVCVSPVNQEFASSLDWFDHVMVFDKFNLSQFREELRKAQFDIAIALFADLPVTYALFMEKIPKRIAPATKLAQIFVNHKITQRRSHCAKTEWEYNLDLLQALGIHNFDFPRPLISFSQQEIESKFQEFCLYYQIPQTSRMIALHPGSGGSAGVNLTLEEYFDLALHLKNIPQVIPIFSLGPDEKHVFQKIQENPLTKNFPVYMGTQGAIESIKFLSAIDLFISTSTGASHLAGVANIPTLTMFSSQGPPSRWQPISEQSKQHHFILHPQEQKRFLEKKLIPYLDSLLLENNFI